MEVTITVNLENIAHEVYTKDGCFKDEFIKQVRYSIVRELREKYRDEIASKILKPMVTQARKTAEKIGKELLEKDLATHKFKINSYSDEMTTIPEIIEKQISDTLNSNLTAYLNKKAKEYVTEIRNRYDLTFASLIVQNMREQKLLADDRIAELLVQKKD